jgi:iron complex outermembrane receptor protein
MNFRLSLLTLVLSVPVLAGAQSAPAPSTPHGTVRLDDVVVSAGLDDKTAFDLAQGTAIVSGEELRTRTAATLGETLAGQPGVSATSYGPGASRPIIRGLGGDRIRVLEDGVGSLDASSVSPDHQAAVEPLFASRIEVLRGPATLLYGGAAVGGAVNVIGNSIPSITVTAPLAGILEFRGGSAAEERTGVAALTLGQGAWVMQVNALQLQTDDLSIPGVARIDGDAPAGQPDGTLPNSDIDTRSGSLGLSWIGKGWHAGAAVSSHTTFYGIPVDEPIGLDLNQRRLDLEAAGRMEAGLVRGFRFRAGFSDYEHKEIEDRVTVNTAFRNRAWEARFEVPHALGADVGGTVGIQASRSDFAAVGAEVVTPPYLAISRALFALEDWSFPGGAVQVGGRIEHQSIRLGEVDPGLPPVPGFAAVTGQKVSRTGTSGSAGLVLYPAPDWSVAASLAYTERLPTAQELFSNGPHAGTGAWEVGTSDLGKERATGFDLSLRRRAGFVTGSVGVFQQRFRDFIFEEELPSTAIADPDGLTPYQYVARDAEFRGFEAELTFHLYETAGRHLHLELSGDTVRARETAADQPLPRIPAAHHGARLEWEDARWNLALEARTTLRQDRVAPGESASPGYTLVNASASFRLATGSREWELFASGRNLTNRIAREHTSFLKDFAPQAGRGIVLGTRLSF